MEDTTQMQPSTLQEAIEFLADSGMDRVLAEALIRPAPTLPQSGGFEDRVTKLMESFSQRLDQLAARIDGAGVVDETFTEILLNPAPQRQMPCFWADRLLDETPDYNTIISWPDNEDTNGQNLVEVSDTTAELLKSSFTRSLPNATRLALKKGYAVPKVDATKCPKLDRVMRGNVSKNTKDGDSTATKIQTLMLDAVAPLVHILEEGQKGTLTPEVAIKASKVTLELLGNVSAHQSKERRKNVLKDMNRDVTSLAEEKDQFKDGPLYCSVTGSKRR